MRPSIAVLSACVALSLGCGEVQSLIGNSPPPPVVTPKPVPPPPPPPAPEPEANADTDAATEEQPAAIPAEVDPDAAVEARPVKPVVKKPVGSPGTRGANNPSGSGSRVPGSGDGGSGTRGR